MPQVGNNSPGSLQKELFHAVGIDRYGLVEKPTKCDRRIEDKATHVRPSSIKFFAFKPRSILARFLIFSMSLKTSLRLASGATGTRTAASRPRRVIPIFSPSRARSTSSESFCLASNNPKVRIVPYQSRLIG